MVAGIKDLLTEMLFAVVGLAFLLFAIILMGAFLEALGRLNEYLLGFCLGMVFYPALIDIYTKIRAAIHAWKSPG